MKKLITKCLRSLGYDLVRWPPRSLGGSGVKFSGDVDPMFVQLYARSPLFTVPTKLMTTYSAVRYVIENDIPGDLVECGVWEGRHPLMMALTLLELGRTDRDIYLYDTFTGMTEPGDFDAKVSGRLTSEESLVYFNESAREGYNDWCYCPLEKVKENVLSSGYPEDRIHFVEGDVLKTIPNDYHDNIAILRLDTDWYELTRHELIHMYDLITPKGLLILDDYGSWEGCRKAVHEFFEKRDYFPYLNRTDRMQRVCLKPSH